MSNTADPIRVPVEPVFDLHPFAPSDVRSVVQEYLAAAHDAGFTIVRIVHGRGRGVQRAIVRAILDRHPLVADFWDASDSHLGATVVRLLQHL